MIGLYNFLQKRGQLFALLLGVVCVAIVFISIFSGLSSSGFDAGTDLNSVLKNGGGNGFNFLDPAIALPALLVGLTAFVWLASSLIRMIMNPKSSLIGIIAIAVILGVFFVLYSSADINHSAAMAAIHEKFSISDGVSKFISAGLKTTIGLAVLAFLSMVVSEIINLFK